MSKIVLVTGGFDPIHTGHISYLTEAKKLGDILIVGVNSDAWLTRKKGRPFMPSDERAGVIQALSMVDVVVQFADDYDIDNSAIKFIEDTLDNYPEHEVIFANGGDRTNNNIPEMSITDPRLTFEFGVGGNDKKNSSSWILEEWKNPKTVRPWGWYRVLDDKPGYKVKELVIEPGKSLSNQRHFKRAEHWYVLKGMIKLDTEWKGLHDTKHIKENDWGYTIGREVWHQASNPTNELAHILEVQYGDACVEEDIERKQ